jgi:exoribonuclease R
MQVFIKSYLYGPHSLVCVTSGDIQTIDTPPPPHYKWKHGDLIDSDNKIVRHTSIPPLVGILHTTNRTGYGFTARGVPLYMFYPLDEKWPPFIVGCRDHYSNSIIVVVRFEYWTEKWPRGGLDRILGPAGNIEVEKNALRLRVSPPIKLKYDNILPTPNLDFHTKCKDDDFDIVCNIDPDGCEDVDDIFGWKKREDGTMLFFIGIADVASFLQNSPLLQQEAKQKGATVYENGSVHDSMLPTIISHSLASLRCDGEPRPVLALVYSITSDGRILNSKWEQLCIKITHRFSYENILEHKDICRDLCIALQAIRNHTMGDDPHDWVAEAMIEYNRRAAEILRMNGVGILRAHQGLTRSEFVTLAAKTGCKEMEMLGMSAGRYLLASEPADAISHTGLGLAAYTHASSPLRRYADLYNQFYIKHIIFHTDLPTPDHVLHTHLNSRMREIKHFERDLWFLENLQLDTITNVDAYIIKQKKNGMWQLYVPLWKRNINGRSGLHNITTIYNIGDKVYAEVYCDLKQTSWSQRFICRFS